jgi:hypothetical protein
MCIYEKIRVIVPDEHMCTLHSTKQYLQCIFVLGINKWPFTCKARTVMLRCLVLFEPIFFLEMVSFFPWLHVFNRQWCTTGLKHMFKEYFFIVMFFRRRNNKLDQSPKSKTGFASNTFLSLSFGNNNYQSGLVSISYAWNCF